ncbi:C40 family peptidase [Paraburkholderia sp. DHOC27]|uniref:C40 family peptidase n=1 Tax=Paraburkholderia sp. DHOC27 TaxID=2303330 RepID=UPI000E3DDC04|nr:C40 family peptidase [Paraburkholderia sp. DHOC27]RFU47836.1 peptidoglycan endopeptidase [Paraburkholderia sp. DHOC27]
MRRPGFPLLVSLLALLLLAACSGAPQRTSRNSSGSTSASNGAYRTTPPGFPNFVDHSIGREEISIQAMSLVGIPYRWGGNTPESGFDCSGLVRYVVARSASVNLPRTTADMSERGESVDPDEVAPGDLIFFNTTGRPHSHVGIYVGKLRFVNAPSTGGTVRIDYLTNPYWAKRFDGIRRVAAPTHAPAPFETPTYQAAAPVAPPAQTAPAVAQTSYGGSAVGRSGAEAAAQGEYATGAVAVGETAQAQTPRVAATAVQVPVTDAGQSGLSNAASTTGATAADAFEPPPPAMSAAQMQARDAGAVTPPSVAVERATQSTRPSQPLQSASGTAQAGTPASVAHAPDPIDAAADAFEPPPPASVAVRQERQATSSGGVQVMRASTASHGVPARTQSSDDPIANFANGSD